MMCLANVKKQAEDFYARKRDDEHVIYVPEESRPNTRFLIRGVLTVRFVSASEWETFSKDMRAYPRRFLYMKTSSVISIEHRYPVKPKMITHQERMADLLRLASSEDEVIFTFIVGPSKTRFTVHAGIVKLTLPVPLLNGEMMEGRQKTVVLPDDCAETFDVFVKFIYNLEVKETDMWKHAAGLLRLANKYGVEMLHYMCEWYLCWRVQVREGGVVGCFIFCILEHLDN